MLQNLLRGRRFFLFFFLCYAPLSAHNINDERNTTEEESSHKEKKNVEAQKIVIKSQRPVTAASDEKLRKKDFEAIPKKSASDLMRLVPGLHISQHTGGAKAHQFFLRGIDAQHGQDIAGYYEFIPLNEVSQVHGNGYLDLHFLPLESLSEMNIIKGPYLAKWGQYATAGAVTFVPNYLQTHTMSASLEYGSFQSWHSLVEYCPKVKVGSNQKLYGCAQLSYEKTDGYTMPGKMQNFKANANFILEESKETQWKFLYNSYAVQSQAADTLPKRLIDNGQIHRFASIDDSNSVEVYRHILGISRTDTSLLTQSSYQAYVNFKTTDIYSNYTFFTYESERGDQKKQYDQRYYGGLQFLQKRLLIADEQIFTLEYGFQYRVDDIYQQLAKSQTKTVFNNIAVYDFFQHGLGLHLDVIWNLNHHWRFLFGLRQENSLYHGEAQQDRISSIDIYTNAATIIEDDYAKFQKFAWAILPKASVIYQLNPQHSFFVNLGFGSAPYHANEIVWSQRSYLPQIFMGELSWRGDFFDNHLLTSLTAWGALKQKEFVFDAEAAVMLDKGNSQRAGIEAEIKLPVLSWLYYSMNVNYTYSNLSATGAAVPNSAAFIGRQSLVFGNLQTWSVALSTRFLGSRYHAPLINSGSYLLAALNATYSFKHFEFKLSIENLFDTIWYDSVFYYISRPNQDSLLLNDFHVTAGTSLDIKMSILYKM